MGKVWGGVKICGLLNKCFGDYVGCGKRFVYRRSQVLPSYVMSTYCIGSVVVVGGIYSRSGPLFIHFFQNVQIS